MPWGSTKLVLGFVFSQNSIVPKVSTTDVETSTFISIENRHAEEPIRFTTYRQPRSLNQGNMPLHLTPSHFETARNIRGHTLAGRTARSTRPLTSYSQVSQSNWASPATKEDREHPDCSFSPFSNWAYHPKL